MKNKILLIIAILCMLVPFVFAGLSVNAEQYVHENDYSDIVYNCAFTDLVGETDDSPGQYVWTGSPQFNLHFSAFDSNVYPGTYSIPSYFPDDVDMEIAMIYNNSAFSRTINAGYKFTSSSDYVWLSNMDNREHLFVVILSYRGLPRTELESLTVSDVASQFTIDGSPLSNYPSSVSIYEAEIRWVVRDSSNDTGYWRVFTPDSISEYGYGFNVEFPIMQRGVEYPEDDPFVLDNKFFMITYPFGNRGFNFGGSSTSHGKVIAMYDIYTTTSDYTAGFDAGFQEGYYQGYQQGVTNGNQELYNEGYQQGLTVGMQQANSTVNTNSASYQAGLTAGMQQANSTVNTNSASYQAGLIQGREDANNLTFMSLIGAVLDAPIRAFFGFTDSNGVQHPGLFTLEILGFDMSAVILSIFTLCVIIVIIRMCLGGGK